MDGTITKPRIDYAAIRADLDVPDDEPIWETIQSRDPTHRRQSLEKLHIHEAAAAADVELADGAADLLDWLAKKSLPTAVITRNSRASATTIFARHGLPDLLTFTREDAPPKPDPTVVHTACERLGTTSTHAWMVGDGVFDVEVAHNAGATGIWLALGRGDCPHLPPPHRCIEAIGELKKLIQSCDPSEPKD